MWTLSLIGLLAAGCEKPGELPPEDTALDADRGPEAEQPLPPRALVPLEDIQPPVTAPENPPGADELPDRVKKLVTDAETDISAGDYPGAVGKLERAVAFAPNSARVLRGLGLAYAGLRNAGKAVEHLSRAAKLAPDNVQAQAVLGRLYAAQKQEEQALLALRTATKCSEFKSDNPAAADALLTLAGVLNMQGHWQASLECYTKLSEWVEAHGREYLSKRRLKPLVLQPQRLISERGRLLLLLRRAEEAAEALALAFARDRTDRRTAELLVKAMVAAKQFDSAEKLLGDLADEPSQREQLPSLAYRVCLAAGDKEMPGRIWRSYRAKKRQTIDTSLATSLARTAARLSGTEEATSILEPVMEEMPRSADVGALLSRFYVQQGQFEQAFRLLARLLAGNPESTGQVVEVTAVLARRLKEGMDRRLARMAGKEDSAVKYALHYLAGLLSGHKDNEPLAAAQFNEAIAAKDDFLPAYEGLADLMLANKRFDEALLVGRRLRKLEADHYFAYYIEGKVKLASRDVQAAIEALKRARSRNADHRPSWLLLASAHERAGEFDAAEKLLAEAGAKWSADDDISRAVFDWYVKRRRYERAGLVARKLLVNKRNSMSARIMQAELYMLAGNAETARKKLSDLRSENPEDVGVRILAARIETHTGLGELYRQQYLRIVRRLREVVSLHPANAAAGVLLAKVLSREDESAEAAAVLKQLKRYVPESLDVERALLAASVRAEMHAEAAEIAEGLLRENPADIFSRGALLDSLVALERHDEAVRTARRWLEEARVDAMALWHKYKLLEVLENTRRYDEAQGLLDDWIAADAKRKNALLGKKLALYEEAEDYDAAIRFVRRRTESSEEAGMPRRLLASMLLDAEQYDKLEPLLVEWTGEKRDKSVEPYRLFLVVALGRAGRKKEAIDYATAWIAEDRYNPAPRQAIVEVLRHDEDHKQAGKLSDAWIKELSAPPQKEAPGRPEALAWCRISAVSSLMLRDKYKEALERLEEYVRAEPDSKALLQLRSSCLTELGMLDKALADLEAIHKLQPDDAMANNNLGYTYADMGVKLPQAHELIRKALALSPDERSIQDSLGWVYYKQGKMRLAGGVFGEMIRRGAPEGMDDLVIFDHAGDTYYRLGWTDRAVKMWRKAVEHAKGEQRRSRDVRRILSQTPRKLRAVKAGRRAKVAPPGEGVRQDLPR